MKGFTWPGWPDIKSMIATLIIVAFFVAYFRNPDDTMKGALLAAFAASWGYYLGSSKGAAENRVALNKVTDALTPDKGTNESV